MAVIIPFVFIFVFVFATFKRVNVYKSFAEGVKGGVEFTLSILPYLATIFMMCELFEGSGLSTVITNLLSPIFSFLGIPKELTKLVLIKPFSGSGSLAYLNSIIKSYGADSYISRCACVCYGSSETVFYISAVYFANSKTKNLLKPIFCVLFATFISTIFACFICKFI